MKNWLKAAARILVLWVLVHLAYTAYDGLRDAGKTADLGVILGNKVNEDGTLSERLRKRLECGLAIYQQHRVPRLLVSGGRGKEGFWEGDKMREFLLQNGVPDSAIIVDNYGNNTQATVKNTLRLRDSLHFRNLLVVSQFYHLTRTKMLFHKAGFANVSSVAPHYFEWRDCYSLVREFAAFYVPMP